MGRGVRRAIGIGAALAVGLAAVYGAWHWARESGRESSVRILTARKIVTMEPDPPAATAVAIEDGRIVAVGSLEEVRAALGDLPYALDERLAEKVLLPGFIDPHLHPTLAGTILPMDIVSAMEWVTPSGRTRAVRGRDAFLARLRELEREQDDDDWLLVWGYHAPYHGELSRLDLDAISSTRPILRSVSSRAWRSPSWWGP